MRIRILGALLFGLFVQQAQAVTFYPCNACTEAQRASMALSLGLGNRYIDDIQSNVAEKFSVTREPNGHGYQYFVDQVAIEAFAQTGFTNYRNFVLANGSSNVVFVNVPANPRPQGFPSSANPYTAIDFAGSSSPQNTISMWLANVQMNAYPNQTSWMSGAAMAAILVLNSPVAFNGSDITIEFNISLTDGGVVVFDLNSHGATMIKSIDKNGNTIPRTKAQVQGQYIFGQGPAGQVDLNTFVNYLSSVLGVTVTINGGSRGVVCVGGVCSTQPF